MVTLIDGVLQVGLNEVRWDGVSKAGHEVSSGAYFVRLNGGSSVVSTVVTLVR